MKVEKTLYNPTGPDRKTTFEVEGQGDIAGVIAAQHRGVTLSPPAMTAGGLQCRYILAGGQMIGYVKY